MKSTVKNLALGLVIAAMVLATTASPALAATVSRPAQQSPVGNALVTTDTPTLKWRASTENPPATLSHYEYEVSTDSGFLIIVAANNVPAGTLEDVIGPLDRAKTYFWRVRACDLVTPPPNDCSAWSTTSFRVSVDAPLLIAPLDMSYLTTNRDKFEWSSVLNATGYAIQVSNSSLFTSLIINATTAATVTEFTPTADLPVNQTLYWRVRALNNTYGPGPWSDVWTFTTAMPPSIPTLLQPQDKKMTTDYSPGLLWTKSTLPSGTTFEGYHVQVAEDTDFTVMAWEGLYASTDINQPWGEVDDLMPLNPATTYYWRVRACNNDGVHTFCSAWPAYFTLHTSLDAAFLMNPPDLTVLTENRPLFEWTAVFKAMNYILELSTTNTFTTVAYRWVTPNTYYVPLSPLPPNVTYYWRVRGGHPTYGPGLSSEVWSFTTANPPARPTLQSPASNALVTSTTPTLTWTFSSTPPGTTFDYYHVQIDDNADFSSPEEDNTNVINQYTPYLMAADYNFPLNPLTRYYWRVRACNTDPACSEWSTPRNFRVAADAPVNLVSAYPILDWDDVVGASSYFLELRRNGVLIRRFTSYISEVNVGLLGPGTYTWQVRVRTTFVSGFAPSAWSVTDMFILP